MVRVASESDRPTFSRAQPAFDARGHERLPRGVQRRQSGKRRQASGV
jgi:hypothetical protein